MSSALNEVLNDVILNWAKNHLEGKKKDDIRILIETSIDVHMQNAITRVSTRRIEEILTARINEATDSAIKKWIDRNDLLIPHLDERVKNRAEEILKSQLDKKPNAKQAANLRGARAFRMNSSGIPVSKISKNIGLTVKQTKDLLKSSVRKAEAAKSEYNLFYGKQKSNGKIRRRSKMVG